VSEASASIDQALRAREVLVACGTGGVGKTTLSAALAVRAALQGRRAVVLTIDPAKRLATSLGLRGLGDAPTDLTADLRGACARAGVACPGTLHALMPDTRQTFEAFVADLAPSPATAARILRNPIFRIFAKEFSGTNEYMALQRLFALHRQGGFDCIILDTPPSRNTLAFLDAPKRLAQFFEQGIIQWLVIPANKILAVGMRKALGLLERLTGAGFMTHLFEFAQALFEVRESFLANLDGVTRLLESERTGFLLVAAPTPDTVSEARHFIGSVREHRFRFEGLVMNRTLGYLADHPEDWARLPAGPAREAARALIAALQAREARALAALGTLKLPVYARLPELARDVHSVEDLLHVALALDRDRPERPAPERPSNERR
jgi:anion-transporting  ArsA/GET3 family ATPase